MIGLSALIKLNLKGQISVSPNAAKLLAEQVGIAIFSMLQFHKLSVMCWPPS